MSQITLYLDRETEEKMKAAAKAAGTSQSQWVATLIREKTTQQWPAAIVQLVGSWPDDFPTQEEIRGETVPDLSREPL